MRSTSRNSNGKSVRHTRKETQLHNATAQSNQINDFKMVQLSMYSTPLYIHNKKSFPFHKYTYWLCTASIAEWNEHLALRTSMLSQLLYYRCCCWRWRRVWEEHEAGLAMDNVIKLGQSCYLVFREKKCDNLVFHFHLHICFPYIMYYISPIHIDMFSLTPYMKYIVLSWL